MGGSQAPTPPPQTGKKESRTKRTQTVTHLHAQTLVLREALHAPHPPIKLGGTGSYAGHWEHGSFAGHWELEQQELEQRSGRGGDWFIILNIILCILLLVLLLLMLHYSPTPF